MKPDHQLFINWDAALHMVREAIRYDFDDIDLTAAACKRLRDFGWDGSF